MKKILTVFAALAMVAGLASSCQKEGASTDNPAQGKLVNVKLTAALEYVSKVTYSENNNILTPAWEEGDAILVINQNVDPSTLTVTSIDGDGYATLEGNAEVGLVHLVYKKGIDIQDWEDSEIRIGYNNQYINEDMPAVMFADGTVSGDGSGSFTFRNAGAVIGIWNAKGVPADSKIDQVTIIGSNLSAATVSVKNGELVLEAEEIAKDTVETVTLSLDGITVENGETGALSEEILIAVPAGAKVEKVTLSVGEATYSYTLAAAKTCNANDYLYVKTQQFKKDVVLPQGALSGVFSVSATKKVYFSQGNLTYNVSTKTWAFYEHQYDCATAYDANLISFFAWGYNAEKSIIPDGNASDNVSRTSGNLSQEEDWGCTIGDGKTWRTPSNDEWVYLFNTRTASTVSSTENARYAKATVNGNAGIILLPDTYEHPAGVTAFTSINTDDAVFTVNSYDLTAWKKMESAGCVFLPAAGFRGGSDLYEVGVYGNYWSSIAVVSGRYWSSTADSLYAFYVYFNSYNVFPCSGDFRDGGVSVRLITESK